MSMRLRIASGFGVALVVMASAGPLSAQFQVTPYFAGYYPVGNLGTAGQIEAVQDQGMGGGLSLGYMFSDRLGVQLAGTFLVSDAFVRACNFDPTNFPNLCLTSENLNGWIMLGDLVLKFRPANSNFFLLLGPGMVYRGGDAWTGYSGSEKMSFGGVIGLGVIARVAPKFALEIQAEAHGYSFDPDGSDSSGGTSFSAKFRPDLVLKVGIPFPSR
jgi:hypothetical protein